MFFINYILPILIFVPIGVTIIFGGISWSVHISMTRSSTKRYGYGWASFKKFKREFDKIEWEYKSIWKNSLFGNYLTLSSSQFHASIIEFNTKGMIMRTPLDWYLAKRYVKKHIKNNFLPPKPPKVKW